jgi:hypothetical protein
MVPLKKSTPVWIQKVSVSLSGVTFRFKDRVSDHAKTKAEMITPIKTANAKLCNKIVIMATTLLLRIGSIEPSAMLLDATDAFESGSAASDEAARFTKTGMLHEAIESCAEAAAKEFDIATQKRLLRAVCSGYAVGMQWSNKYHMIWWIQTDQRGWIQTDQRGPLQQLQHSFIVIVPSIRSFHSN